MRERRKRLGRGSRCQSAAFVLFDVLAQRSNRAFLATDRSFEFHVQIPKKIPVICVDGGEQDLRQIGKCLQRKLDLGLQVGNDAVNRLQMF